MTLTEAQLSDFNLYATNPETWIFAAKKHLAVAQLLHNHQVVLRQKQSRSLEEYSGCHSAMYLHAGIALENAVKAVLINRDPTIILSTGRLNKEKLGIRGGHALYDLVSKVLSSLTENEERYLQKLEEYVVWAGRYGLPTKASTLYDDDLINNMRQAGSDEQELLLQLFTKLLNLVSLES